MSGDLYLFEESTSGGDVSIVWAEIMVISLTFLPWMTRPILHIILRELRERLMDIGMSYENILSRDLTCYSPQFRMH